MKIRKLILCTILLCMYVSHGYAYNIYNQTGYDVFINEKRELGGGIYTPLLDGAVHSCAPASRGCNGDMHFYVFPLKERHPLLCSWQGKIGKESGNYFIITRIPGSAFCKITHYHD